MSRLGLTGVHALPLNRRWVEIHYRSMPLRGLPPSFDGWRLVQISDLHYSPVVWRRYLIQLIHWVNDLKPDLVAVTGDLITGGYPFAHRVATLLSHLHARHGVICTLGNHDYSIHGRNGSDEGCRRADYLADCLRKRGLVVLRNQVMRLSCPQRDGQLVIVGLDDDWSGHMDADMAFNDVNANQPVICLNHNPANAPLLLKYPWQWMLSGHTHGRQVATSRFGRTFYPHRYRHYIHGYYGVGGRHLYVNRGISYGKRVESWCRPEITVFRLQAEQDS